LRPWLVGHRGDELFGGYDRYYGNLYASYYSKLPEILRRQLVGPALSLLPAAGWYKSVGHQLRWLHRLSFLEGSERYAASLSYFYFDREHRRSIFTAASHLELAAADAEYALKAPFDALQGDLIDRMLYADSKVRLPDHPVMISDRMSMAHSLEVRPPFLDHRIVEFAATLPRSLKMHGSRQKIVLKQLMKDKLPEMILERKKVGFDIPAHEWLRGPLRELLLDTMQRGLIENKSLFRPGTVQELVRLHLERRINVGYQLWGLLLLFLWMKKWRIQAAPSPAPASWIQEKTGIST